MKIGKYSFVRGKVNLLVGKNGSGKTTLLRGLLREPGAFRGDIDFPSAEKLSYLPQEPVFPDHLKVRDLLKLAFLLRKDLYTDDKIESALKEFDLKRYENQILGRLSSGERQKAFLARTLLQPCEVLLLDEPTNHLDTDITDLVWEKVARLPAQGVEVIASTHDREIIKNQKFNLIRVEF